ncbi:hypothetical protein Lsai_1397 [Legionella sainthelensi]|uniref:DUF3800 domain-containing protein n=1 Tax=Legionella sainthelensi TaxID=28087 RepID=A0A0W0YQG9_9GAMM|nr:DUF3800 domain-containing protein [Legionella sainthelensi]KTD58790.1 hypothetical protein Lsai_1397 [Legionella sainthelensi]VEH34165.1 Protein of uncharacterised function (DUF3800) [Legionella sainthelensi]
MYFIYIDDSGNNEITLFVALAIKEENWKASFQSIKSFRRLLKHQYKIPTYKELHSWKLVSGRGNISPLRINKQKRVKIFNDILSVTVKLPDIKIFAAVDKNCDYLRCFERLLNRIQTTMQKTWKSNALIFCDQGHSNLTKLRRKMATHNFIPSNQEISEFWSDTGTFAKNITVDNIIEDIIYKDSKNCIFIQLADACAYALLRCEKHLESKNKLGLHKSFSILDEPGVLALKGILKGDPLGIIRS